MQLAFISCKGHKRKKLKVIIIKDLVVYLQQVVLLHE